MGLSPSLLSLRNARRDPIAFLERVPADRPVVEFALSRQRAFLVNDPAIVHDVLVANDVNFRKPPALDRAARLLGRGLLTAEGRVHALRRKVIQPVFHRDRMSRYADAIVAQTARHTAPWSDGRTLDVMNEMTTLTLGVIGDVLFSTDLRPLAPELRRILADAVDGLDPLVALVAPARRLGPLRRRLHEIVQDLIDARLTSGERPDDLLTLLLESSGPEATLSQLHDDVTTLLLAGHDTIGNALTWTWGWLGEHPAVEARLHLELDEVLGGRAAGIADVPRLPFTRAVLAESLRLNPPAWIIARTALKEHSLGDVIVPAGGLVVISPYLLHRDRRFFANPLVFDPSRWVVSDAESPSRRAYIPFGAGRRSCIGESFAWLEGVLVLATVAQTWRLSPINGRPPVDARITLRPRGPVWMRSTARR